MSETKGAPQKEKAAKVKRKPDRESPLQLTFAAARHNTDGNLGTRSQPGSGLLQRQCACGTHTIAGGECSACRQKRAGRFLQRTTITPATTINEANAARAAVEVQSLPEAHFTGDFSRVPVTAGVSSRPAQPIIQLGRLQENHPLQRAVWPRPVASQSRLVSQGIIQRTPLSDELEKSSAKKSAEEIFTLLSQKKFRDGGKDPTELSALNKVLDKVVADVNNRWVAKKILAGKLGMTLGIKAKSHRRLKKDIPSQPVEVHFVPGASQERALVIAGVHGSERQGTEIARMLINDVLQKAKPHYTVIIVPSLFPDHAHKNWGVEGIRERATFTNRNFPGLDKEVAQYKGGQALDAAGKPLKAEKDEKGNIRPILLENVMLMELIDRFQPTRIISIHGTHTPSSAGVFADPHFLSPAKKKAIKAMSELMANPKAAMKSMTKAAKKLYAAQTQNDFDLALAAAYAIAAKTGSLAELKARFSSKARKKFPSVAGNKLYEGAGNENVTWREDFDKKKGRPIPWQQRAKNKGISLGLYGPAKGISVFTIEPPINRALDFYNGKHKEPGGGVVPKAQRETELKAYADAVATILLGPDAGAKALSKNRPPKK